jgi:hypothetical protein
MRLVSALTLWLLLCFSVAGQTNYNVKKITWEKSAILSFSDTNPDWEIALQNIEVPAPGGSSYRAQLRTMKQELRKKYPIKSNNFSAPAYKTDTIWPLLLGRNFEGNIAQNSIPNDNDMAISNAGIIVSVINSRVLIYDTNNDSILKVKTLGSFASGLNTTDSKFDPKMVYDPAADRFIMVFLNGSTFQKSKIIVCYSQTNDPMGDWNAYALSGNPLGNDTWSDYPVIGISNSDLFIGINTFTNGSTNNSGFTETCLWQISNDDGYAGNALTTNYYHDILLSYGIKPIFNICPIKGGLAPYGPDMFLLSNRATSFENDSVFLLHITNNVKSNNASLEIKFLTADIQYILPPEARQEGTHTFDTNDNRVLGGFYENNVIQFVQSCLNETTGLAGIYHGFIENPGAEQPNVRATIIGDTVLDFGYPNISYSGRDHRDQESVITFNHTSPVDYAGFSYLYYTNEGEYTGHKKIKTGENYVDAFGDGNYERWGDYSGSQRRYNETATVWAVGSWGKETRKNGTWIAELTSTDSIRPDEFPGLEITAYPNPTTDLVTLNFYMEKTSDISVDLYDMNGRRVILLFQDQAKFGQNIFTFSTAPLAAGIYFATITSEEKHIYKQKIVKAGRP